MPRPLPHVFASKTEGESIELVCVDGTRAAYSTIFSLGKRSNVRVVELASGKTREVGKDVWPCTDPERDHYVKDVLVTRPSALTLKGDDLAVVTVLGTLVCGKLLDSTPRGRKTVHVPRACLDVLEKGMVVGATQNGGAEELMILGADKTYKNELVVLSTEPLFHCPTCLKSTENRVAVLDTSSACTLFARDGKNMQVTHVLPQISFLLSLVDDTLVVRETASDRKVTFMDVSTPAALSTGSVFASNACAAAKGFVHTVEPSSEGEPQMVTYRLSSGEDGRELRRHPPKMLSGADDRAVDFCVSHNGDRAVVVSRGSRQVWIID